MDSFFLPVTKSTWVIPACAISSTTYCTVGLRPTGSISLGWDLVAGRRRVPAPATGITALRTARGAAMSAVVLIETRSAIHCPGPRRGSVLPAHSRGPDVGGLPGAGPPGPSDSQTIPGAIRDGQRLTCPHAGGPTMASSLGEATYPGPGIPYLPQGESPTEPRLRPVGVAPPPQG